jgi:Flp pilus assembly pilin Flp
MRHCKRKGQGILEYTLLLGAIIAIVVIVLMGNGGIGSKVKDTYSRVGNATNGTLDKASNSTAGAGVMNGL